MSTSPVLSVTDELMAELDAKTEKFVGFGIRSDTVARLVTELRRLRAENAELGGLLREAGKTIHKLQAEQPTPLRIARYLDAMRAKIDTAMATQ